MAGIAIGKSLEVILMLRLGVPEVAGWKDLGNDLGGPKTCSIDVGNRIFGNPPLLVAGIENCRSIAGPDVVALAIARAGVVNLKEEFENLPIVDTGGIKDDLDGFGVGIMIAIGRMGPAAACVADPRRQNAVAAANEVLYAPEATASKNGAFIRHWTSSTWFK